MMFGDILDTDPKLRELITTEDQQLISDLILGNVIKGRAWISETLRPQNSALQSSHDRSGCRPLACRRDANL